jgi:hypothetical protein
MDDQQSIRPVSGEVLGVGHDETDSGDLARPSVSTAATIGQESQAEAYRQRLNDYVSAHFRDGSENDPNADQSNNTDGDNNRRSNVPITDSNVVAFKKTSDDDDDCTVIFLDASQQRHESGNVVGFFGRGGGTHQRARAADAAVLNWIEQGRTEEMEQRRLDILAAELKRVQKTSFWHFLYMCALPVMLLLVILLMSWVDSRNNGSCDNIMGDSGTLVQCHWEPRTMLSAFTTRCICEAIPVSEVIGSNTTAMSP